jgi:hypothetical protein
LTIVVTSLLKRIVGAQPLALLLCGTLGTVAGNRRNALAQTIGAGLKLSLYLAVFFDSFHRLHLLGFLFFLQMLPYALANLY